ncbi:MAG TPA: hypothetical protein VMC78_12685 [Mycobacterium sp.]|nr:hypothetical protein [Mycobacterium sp.]
MSMHVFRGNDAGYVSWLEAHPAGFVINIHKSYNLGSARFHDASCYTLHNQRGTLTDPYIKVCADQLVELEAWEITALRGAIQPCGSCQARPRATHTRVIGAASAAAGAAPAGRYLVPPPEPHSSVVEAWADDYIRFENEPEWQKTLRREITSLCANLNPSADEVLHATFYGEKPARMDIENLALCNLHYSFKQPGRNGIRFEHGLETAPPPDGEAYQVSYRYELAFRSNGFTDWELGRTVASFGWTDLGEFRRNKVPAQVWLALARRRAGNPQPPLAARTSFAVKVKIRPPHQNSPGPTAELLKGVVDGVVCAFQAHTDTSTSAEVAVRLAKVLPAEPAEIERLLLERRWAVLGAVPRLVILLKGDAVQWNPGDDWCDAGELLAALPEPLDPGWAISGQIFELSRRKSAMPPISSMHLR